MKDRPILFSAPMVRAILEGRKTQTRRVVKPQPASNAILPNSWSEVMKRRSESPDIFGGDGLTWGNVPMVDGSWGDVRCPYGQPGDRLWVREAFAVVPRTAYANSDGVQQTLRPDDPYDHDAAIYREGWSRSNGGFRWRPSIHMPRWASRILLEVTGVRVERLNDISHDDATAEGMAWDDAVYDYSRLWDAINGPGSWEANPWLWVVDFKWITP